MIVIPVKTGIQPYVRQHEKVSYRRHAALVWIPAFAGMTT
jgi:hypothetical protein